MSRLNTNTGARADVDAVAGDGRTVDDFARRVLEASIWYDPHHLPRDTRIFRAPGVAEGALALFRDFRDFSVRIKHRNRKT